MNPTKSEFAAALERWADGARGPEEWEKFIITHYMDEQTEEVRRQVARLLVFENSPEQWPPSEMAAKRLRELAKVLVSNAA